VFTTAKNAPKTLLFNDFFLFLFDVENDISLSMFKKTL